MKRKEKAKVISQTNIAPGIYDLVLESTLAADAHAGQFVGVFANDASKLLPRPVSICEVNSAQGVSSLRLVYRVTGKNTGTQNISGLVPGDEVSILGVLGNGYDVQKLAAGYSHPVLLGGGIGIPPMLELAKEINSNGVRPAVILGYRDKDTFLLKDFEAVSDVYIATEDGTVGTKGNVLDVLKTKDIPCDVIAACGPMPMLKAVAAYAGQNGIKAYVSLEERMACGVGACLGCVTKTKETDEHSQVKNARICTEGPVFDTEELAL